MARCNLCGRSGFFLWVDMNLGLCQNCIDNEYNKSNNIFNNILFTYSTLCSASSDCLATGILFNRLLKLKLGI